MDLINKNRIFFDIEVKNKEELIEHLVRNLETLGLVESVEGCISDVLSRESEISTGFVEGIAIPHAQSEHAVTSSVSVARLKRPIDWETLDDSEVIFVFLICVPKTSQNEHLKILANLAGMLVDEEFCKQLVDAISPEEIMKIVEKGELI